MINSSFTSFVSRFIDWKYNNDNNPDIKNNEIATMQNMQKK